MPWGSRVGPAVRPLCRCRHGQPTRSSSSLSNPVVRYVVSSTPQTSKESEHAARRDSYQQRRRPNVRGDPDELSAMTNAIVKKKEEARLAYGVFYVGVTITYVANDV